MTLEQLVERVKRLTEALEMLTYRVHDLETRRTK